MPLIQQNGGPAAGDLRLAILLETNFTQLLDHKIPCEHCFERIRAIISELWIWLINKIVYASQFGSYLV